MFVRCYSENAEMSILIKLMKEKVDLKQAGSLLESERTKQKDDVNLSQYSCESCLFIGGRKSNDRPTQ